MNARLLQQKHIPPSRHEVRRCSYQTPGLMMYIHPDIAPCMAAEAGMMDLRRPLKVQLTLGQDVAAAAQRDRGHWSEADYWRWHPRSALKFIRDST